MERSDRLEERIAKRRERRWKRRGRIAAPFLALPILLGTLLLSVDLIEYRPVEPEPDERPRAKTKAEATTRPEAPAPRLAPAVLSTPVLTPAPGGTPSAGMGEPGVDPLDVGLPGTQALRPPRPPYATRR